MATKSWLTLFQLELLPKMQKLGIVATDPITIGGLEAVIRILRDESDAMIAAHQEESDYVPSRVFG